MTRIETTSAPVRVYERRSQIEPDMTMIPKDISETTSTNEATTIKRIPPESFVHLVTSRSFDRIIAILCNKRYSKTELLTWILFDIPHKNLVLHCILPYQPPLEIVHVIASMLLQKTKADIEKMKRKRPNLHYSEELLAIAPESTVDSTGQLPLHVAASNGCDVHIIYQLVKIHSDEKSANRNNAMCRDHSDRLPLHCVCSNLKGIRNFDSDLLSNKDYHSSTQKKGGSSWGFSLPGSHSYNCKMQKENMYKVVELLLKAYPEAVMVRDSDGKRPIDIARSNKADTLILQLLQDCARKQRRIQDSFYKQSINHTAFRNEQYHPMISENQWITETESRNSKLLDLVITIDMDSNDNSVSTLGSIYDEKESKEHSHEQRGTGAGVEESVFSTEVEKCNLTINDDMQWQHDRSISVNDSECYTKTRSNISLSAATVTTRTNSVMLTPPCRKVPVIPTGSITAPSLASSSNYYPTYNNNNYNESSISDTFCSSIYQTRLISDTQVEC